MDVTIALKQKTYDFDELEVQADRNSVDFKVDKQVINVSQQLHAQGGTAADALQVVPSVKVDAEGNVSLRGSTNFTLLVDGRPSMLKASELLNTLPAATIEQIEVITSPSVKYEAKGSVGIINIVSKKKQLEGTEGLATFSIANGNKYAGSLLLTKRFKKVSTYIGYSIFDRTKVNDSWAERTSGLSSQVFEKTNSVRKLRTFTQELKLGADFDLNSKNQLQLNAQIGNWRSEKGFTSDFWSNVSNVTRYAVEDFKNKNKYLSGNANFKHLFAKKNHALTFDLQLSVLDNAIPDYYSEEQTPYFQFINTDATKQKYRSTLDYVLPLPAKLKLETGLFFAHNVSDYLYRFDSRSSTTDPWQTNPNLSGAMGYQNSNAAMYALLQKDFDVLMLQLGLRAEYESRLLTPQSLSYSFKQLDFFPSVHLSKTLSDKQNISLGYSRRINRPNEWQLNPIVNSADRFLLKKGNPDLLPEYTHAMELNYLFSSKKFTLNTQAYVRFVKQYISSYVEYVDAEFVETYDNLENAFNSGADFMIAYNPLKWLRFNLSFSSYYVRWNGSLADNTLLKNEGFVNSGNFRSTFVISKNTYLQFLAFYYAPNNAPQGYTDAFYYFDFILRQQFFKKRLSLTVRTHNTFDTGLLHYTYAGNDYTSENWYHYEGPTIYFNLSYTLNNFKQPKTRKIEIDYDSGYDH